MCKRELAGHSVSAEEHLAVLLWLLKYHHAGSMAYRGSASEASESELQGQHSPVKRNSCRGVVSQLS